MRRIEAFGKPAFLIVAQRSPSPRPDLEGPLSLAPGLAPPARARSGREVVAVDATAVDFGDPAVAFITSIGTGRRGKRARGTAAPTGSHWCSTTSSAISGTSMGRRLAAAPDGLRRRTNRTCRCRSSGRWSRTRRRVRAPDCCAGPTIRRSGGSSFPTGRRSKRIRGARLRGLAATLELGRSQHVGAVASAIIPADGKYRPIERT